MAFNLSCLHFATLPWAPVPPPLAAARSRASVWPSILAAYAPPLCHGPLLPLLMLLPGPFNLPWAPVPTPHAAARSRVCYGSLYGLPIAVVSIATLCHVPLSGLLTLL
ncbi:unnamed protein product, partial [Staurois parvus]